MFVGCVKLNLSDIAKVKKAMVNVTMSYENCAQKHQIYAENVVR